MKNIETAYIELLDFRDYLEAKLKDLDSKSVSYKIQRDNLVRVNNILQKCKESLYLREK